MNIFLPKKQNGYINCHFKENYSSFTSCFMKTDIFGNTFINKSIQSVYSIHLS